MKYFLFVIWLLNCLTYVQAQQTINDLTVKDLKVVSTVKGSKPCPLMTQTQRDAIVSPLNGQCIYNTTTAKLNVYNGSLWKAAGGGVDAWVTATVYAVDDLVIESNRVYKCLIAHTSGTFATDLAASKWVEISSQGNLTGAVTSSGLATLLGSFSSSNLLTALTDKTGTGLSVFSTTPTFTTNLTAPLLIGGTGTTSTLTYKTTSGVGATGADHIFQVGNNGATEAMRIFNSGFVGIGTPSPTSLLHLSASSSGPTSIIENTNSDSNGVTFNLYKNSASPAANDSIGDIQFTSKNSSASGRVYSSIQGLISSPTGGAENGMLKLKTFASGSSVDTMTLVSGNVGIGTSTPNANAILDVTSTTKAVMMPRMTTTQKNAIASPTAGMEVYDSTLNIKQYYNGTQWVANTNIQLDNTYSATLDSAAGVARENADWISGNCVASGASSYIKTCTFNTGIFTQPPSCVAVATTSSAYNAIVSSSTSSQVVVQTTDNSNTPVTSSASIVCQKSSPDYQSTDAYIASNGDYDWTDYSPTISGLGTVSPASNQCKHRRIGGNLDVQCSFTTGTVAGSLFSITLPNSLTIDSSRITSTNTTAAAGQSVGVFAGSSANIYGSILTATGTSTSLLYAGNGVSGGSTLVPSSGSTGFASSTVTTIRFSVPISGWTNSNLIVASLAGTPNIPGLITAVDTFSVSYGTTNISTVCSASPCSYLDQIGNAVTSVTRSGAGAYAINTTKTYAKLKCVIGTNNVSDPAQCSSCSSVSFTSRNTTTGAAADSLGVINCVGSY